MSHELSITNKVEMAYLQSDGTPWHNLGQPMADGSTLEEWAEATNFSNFVFKTAPVIWYDAATDDCYEYSSRKVVYRSDNRAPIGDVGVNFQVDQPMEILQFFDSVIRDFGYTMTSAGLLYGGKKIWAQANVPGEVLTLPGGDTVRGKLLFSAANDGSGARHIFHTMTRVVCQNTLRMATQAGRKEGVRSTHTTSFKPDEVKTQLSLNLSTFEEWSELVNEMATYKVDLDTVQDFYGDLFVYDEKDRELSRTDRLALVQDNKTVEALQTLFFGGGLGSTMESSQGTLWGLLNSVTEYVDHRRNTQTIDARIDQAWFGSFANIKSKAWDNAVLMVR